MLEKNKNKSYSRKICDRFYLCYLIMTIKMIVCDKYRILYKLKCNVLQFLIWVLKCVCIKCVTHIRFLSSKEANIMQNRSFRFERIKTYKLQSAFKKLFRPFHLHEISIPVNFSRSPLRYSTLGVHLGQIKLIGHCL